MVVSLLGISRWSWVNGCLSMVVVFLGLLRRVLIMLGRIWGRYRAKIRKSVTKCMKKVGLVSKIVDKLNENLLNVSLFVLIVLPNGQKSWIWYHNASLLDEFFAVQSKKCDTKCDKKIILVSKKCKKCFFTSPKRSFFFSLPFERIENFVE